MIYLIGDGVRIIVLESANLDEMKKGRPVKTLDGAVLIAWTPDPEWLADALLACAGDGKSIGEAIDAAAKRPEVPLRPNHRHKVVDLKEKK